MSPKVSVVVPVCNVEQYLPECIESIINQTLKEIEIILVDDGSKDASGKICDDYAQKDSRIKVIHKKNAGLGAAYNSGLRAAKGEYIGLVESDDYILPEMYEKEYKVAKELNLDVLKADFIKFYGTPDSRTTEYTNITLPQFYNKVLNVYDDLSVFKRSHNVIWTGLYKNSFLKENKILFNETPGASYQDNGFYFQTYALAQRMYFMSEGFYMVRRDNPNSSIKSKEKVFCMCEEYAFIYNFLKERNLLEKLKGIFHVMAYSNYINTYNRIADEFKMSFLERFQTEIRQAEEKKELNKALFSKKEWKEIQTLLKDIKKFHQHKQKDTAKNTSCKIKNFIQKIKQFITKGNSKELTPSQQQKYYKKLSPSLYPEELKKWYKKNTGMELNLNSPKTFNEKLQWLKIYNATPLKTKLADKYLVRDWVKEKIGEEYLTPLIGVYDRFEDINIKELPERFALKCNHGASWNIIVKDKKDFNSKEAQKKFKKWLKTNFAFHAGLEMQYKNIPPKILVEEYLDIPNNPIEYKMFCFNGKFEFCLLELDFFGSNPQRAFYDRNWQECPFKIGKMPKKSLDKKPKNFDKMVELAEILCQGFAFVRVDFYDVNGKIYFGEMTFTSGSGLSYFEPQEYNLKLGEMITLPEPSPIP